VARVPRRLGQKEDRYAQLLGREPEGAPEQPGEEDRLTILEGELQELRDQLAQLRSELDAIRSP
jgi:uncharacterized protein YceH (UPF0502 family)